MAVGRRKCGKWAEIGRGLIIRELEGGETGRGVKKVVGWHGMPSYGTKFAGELGVFFMMTRLGELDDAARGDGRRRTRG